jgi:hypothetical protein
MDFLIRIEQTGFFTWVRESSSIWAFPTILFVHTIGFGTLAGVNAGIDLRLLGFAPGIPLAPMERLFPVMKAGFWISFVTGTLLLLADASTKLLNPVFYVKIGLIILALINLRLLRTRIFADPLLDKKPLPSNARLLAFTSLVLWLGVTTAGRLMAYIGPVSGLQP